MLPQLRLARAAAYTLKMCGRAMAEKARGAPDERVRELTKEWAAGLSARTGVEVRAFGVDGVDWSLPCVIMANHQSYLDVLALYSASPRIFGFVAKKSLFSIPLFGGVMRAIPCVPIDRDRRNEAFDAVRDAAAQVAAGATIAVFPEGTRSPGDRVAPLKKGPFYLAQLAKAPVIPIGIRGTAALMPRENTSLHPGAVEVHVGAPIPPSAPGDNKARSAFMARVRAEICRLADLPAID
jgi:1-acyl-sn-glycerol-3-phosphate acyltransferase